MLIQYSKNESESLHLKVGRCNIDGFDVEQFRKELIQGDYDLCRVKVAAEDEGVVRRLDSVGFPSYFSGSIRRYKTPIVLEQKLAFKHSDLTFVTYEPQLDDLLFKMLEDTWGNYPIGYYRTPMLNHFIDKSIEIKSVFNFYKENNNNVLNPNNSIQFIQHRGAFVGFFALNKVEGHLESHIGGILAKYQSEGYFFDMLVYIKNYCADNNLSHFVFGARNENAQVQRIFQNAGFIPVGSENVFHVVSLINMVREKGATCNDNILERARRELLKQGPYFSKIYLMGNPLSSEACKHFSFEDEEGLRVSCTYHYSNQVFNGGQLLMQNPH